MGSVVTQQDFELFKQEIKHENQLFQESINNKFELYLSEIDKKIELVINGRLEKIGKLVAWIVGIFVLAFFSYFEYMRTKVDQMNDNRLVRVEQALEDIVFASVGKSVIAGKGQTTDKQREPTIRSASGKSKKVRK